MIVISIIFITYIYQLYEFHRKTTDMVRETFVNDDPANFRKRINSRPGAGPPAPP